MERQYCASTFCIDFENETVLLMYNKKIEKWLQPGGHIEDFELPYETAIRETFEETGVSIKIIGFTYDNTNIEPIAVAHYKNKVGDMIDIQYLSIPLNKKSNNKEGNIVKWYPINELDSSLEIDDEIKVKTKFLYKKYNKKGIINR